MSDKVTKRFIEREEALASLNRLQDAISEMQARGDAVRDQLEDPNQPPIAHLLVQQIHEAALNVFYGVGEMQAAFYD